MDRRERLYKCNNADCTNRPFFTYCGGLLRHQREVHSMHRTRDPYFCSPPWGARSIGTGFSRRENFKEHIRRRHSDISSTTSLHARMGHSPANDDRVQPRQDDWQFQKAQLGQYHIVDSKEARKVSGQPKSYSRSATFLETDECLTTVRRFSHLHSRLLLEKQAELSSLEMRLNNLEIQESSLRVSTDPLTRESISDHARSIDTAFTNDLIESADLFTTSYCKSFREHHAFSPASQHPDPGQSADKDIQDHVAPVRTWRDGTQAFLAPFLQRESVSMEHGQLQNTAQPALGLASRFCNLIHRFGPICLTLTSFASLSSSVNAELVNTAQRATSTDKENQSNFIFGSLVLLWILGSLVAIAIPMLAPKLTITNPIATSSVVAIVAALALMIQGESILSNVWCALCTGVSVGSSLWLGRQTISLTNTILTTLVRYIVPAGAIYLLLSSFEPQDENSRLNLSATIPCLSAFGASGFNAFVNEKSEELGLLILRLWERLYRSVGLERRRVFEMA